MRPTPARILRRRVAQLDAAADLTVDTEARLRHFTSVMTGWTEPEMTALAGGPAALAPSEVEEADELADSCLLLGRLARDQECLVRGPLDRTRQHWIGTSPHELMPHRRPAPDREHFTAPGGDPGPPSTKPFRLGLYTSTARRDGPGMWRMYLDLGSSLHPRPWQTWELPVTDPAADVLGIGGASDWAAFVGRYPLVRGDDVYPDWAKAARDFAGVHMTLRAIVAAQGFRVPVADGLAAAPFWDIESVLWLRWCFSAPRLVEITPPDAPP
ncbi:hypothetical protein [Streptomyces aureoversilis]|uniref:Uncharacterized protein n=1 Tax=Streptomyces aureoversilis TaxID=67277 RepID=A0ABV9ZUE7_9ACTN